MVLNLLLERLSNCYVKPTGCKADGGINLLLERLSNCYVKLTECKADGGIKSSPGETVKLLCKTYWV